MNRQLIFITGERRSGTTLVANFLNGQPNMVVYSDLLKSLFSQAREMGISDPSARLDERARNVLVSNLVAEGLETNVPAFADIRRDEMRTWFDVYIAALGALDPASPFVGTKVTVEYDMLAGLMDRGVKVIFMVRDPRDVMLSSKNRFAGYDVFTFATAWRDSIRRTEHLLASPRFLRLKFEDLLGERRAQTLNELSVFLGTELDQARDPVHRKGTRFRDNSSFGDVSAGFDPRARYRWKEALDAPEVLAAHALLKSEMRTLGYELPDVAPRQLVPVYAAFARHSTATGIKSGLRSLYAAALAPRRRNGA